MTMRAGLLAWIRGLSMFLRRAWGARSGSLTTITAFSAIPMIGFIGLSVDYGMELAAKSKLDHAADAAVIAAITSAQTYIVSYTGSGDPKTDALAVGKAQALAQFKANIGSLPATVPALNVTMDLNGRVLTASASYSFSMPTIFMRVLGTTTASFNGTASSTLTVPAFTNIHIVIDISSSMGIGATLKDQQIVYNAASSCAFACHYSGTTASARNAGATLRVDVAKNAVVSALNQIINSGNANRFRVAVYTMSSQFTTVVPLPSSSSSSNVSDAITKVQSLELSNANYDGGTDSSNALKTLAGNLANDGNGLTAATAQGFVMLITDGVQTSIAKYLSNGSWQDSYDKDFSAYSPCANPNCKTFTQFAVPVVIQSFDSSACTPVKNKGYTLMTLNTKYIVPPANLQGTDPAKNSMFTFVQTYLTSTIASNLASCATSSDYAYSADSPTEITAAVQQMFLAAGAQARITN